MGLDRPADGGLEGLPAELQAAIPSGGYLRRYVQYGWDSTMSPPEFHLASGLAQMAIIMGNKVQIRGPGGRLYPPHLWLALVGPAGAARKTSGISLATELVDAALGEPRSLPIDTTREALWTTLQEQPVGYMVWSEFAGFLARTRSEYMAGLTEDMCEWWDSALEVRRKLQKATYVVRRPAITILAGGVPERLSDLIRGQDLYGGFFSRFLYVNQVTPVPYRGLVGHGDDRQKLHDELQILAAHDALESPRVEVGLNAPERQMWEAYDQALWHMPETRDPFLSGFQSRSGVQALKLAFCYSFARGSLVPEAEDVANAIAFVEFCRMNGARLVEAAEASATQEGREMRKVMAALRYLGPEHEGGWVPRTNLLRKLNMTARRLDSLLETLEEREDIERRDVATGGRPRVEVKCL